MQSGKQTDGFSYWKRPWHKWVVLSAALLQLLCLWVNIREYKGVSGAGILSDFEWARYTAQKSLQFALNGLSAAGFLGIFSIGAAVRSQQAAWLAEGLLLLCMALVWAAAGVTLPLAVKSKSWIVWGLFLLLALGGVYSLWKSRKSP